MSQRLRSGRRGQHVGVTAAVNRGGRLCFELTTKSVITRNVPKDALGLGRAKQENKEWWAKLRREQREGKKGK